MSVISLFFSDLFLLEFCLILKISLPSILLGLIVFDLNLVFQFLWLDEVQLLSLHNVGEIFSVSVALKLFQQMKFVLLQLLDSCIKPTNTSEHLVMLQFEFLYLLSSLSNLRLQLIDFLKAVFVPLFGFIEMGFHVTSGSDSLDRQSLFPFKLISEVVSFIYELIMLLHGHRHLTDSFIFFLLALLSKDSFCSEHCW